MDLRPHDLLRLAPEAIPRFAGAPKWVPDVLDTTPWVVVRRAGAAPGLIAVGVRGPIRSKRYAIEVSPTAVDTVVRPEDLAGRSPRTGQNMPALHALDLLRPTLDDTQLPWGPTGSVGFELATRVRTVTETSDLDLVIRCPHGSALDRLAGVDQAIRASSVRIDCQVETTLGAIALTELAGDAANLMLRTVDGPRLVARGVAIS